MTRKASLAFAAALALSLSTAHASEGPTFGHIRALHDIAVVNGGNRAAGTAGYDRSAEYVAERLRAAGYEVRLEEFEFPYTEERSPPVLALVGNGEAAPFTEQGLRTLTRSGSGEVTAPLQAVDLGADGEPPAISTSGCEPDDFVSFQPGHVALLRRGTCPFQAKVENAVAAGAAAIVIINEGTSGRTEPFSGTLARTAIVPVVGLPFEAGRALAARAGTPIRVKVDIATGTHMTRNVIAETSAGDPKEIIVVGAHLDSVPEGPGINDNASGSAVVIEAALRLSASGSDVQRRVRFAFWAAEERGLIGSRHHLDRLAEDERERIALYINLDMVASPNFGRFLQARGEERKPLQEVAWSALAGYFRDKGLVIEERMRARTRGFGSDDAAFVQKGIPTVGLYTGAGENKGEEQAISFGGTAGQPYDPCYHKACDGIGNVNAALLEQMTEALTTALAALAAPQRRPAP